jgi:hypothetical protein
MGGEYPLVRYESGGQASVINYDLPEPTSFGCRSLVELDIPADEFRSSAHSPPRSTLEEEFGDRSFDEIRSRVAEAMELGFQDPVIFDHLDLDQTFPLGSLSMGRQSERYGNRFEAQTRGRRERTARRRADRFGSGLSKEELDRIAADLAEREDIDETVQRLVSSPAALETIAEHLASYESMRSDGGVQAYDTSTRSPGMDRGPEIERAFDRVGKRTEFGVGDYESVRSYFKPLGDLDPDVIARRIQHGEFLDLRPTLHGDYRPVFTPEPAKPRPQLGIVQRFKISNVLGPYGAGRTLKTVSLFPGEETSIRIEPFTNNRRAEQEAATILESSSREAAFEFERELREELTTSSTRDQRSFWKAGGMSELDLGVFKLREEDDASGLSDAIRERTARGVTSAISSHAQRASARRDIEINTESLGTVEPGSETAIERRVENINRSATLNLIFRQLNQQYISLFHLVDLRIAFTNGYPGSYREAPLHELDQLVDDVVTGSNQAAVKERIRDELDAIFDYTGEKHDDFVTEMSRNGRSFLSVADTTSSFELPDSGVTREFPGIILGSTTNTIRTDGVLVDTLLGQGDALDEYSKGLQEEAVRSQRLDNQLLDAEQRKRSLGLSLVEDGSEEDAKLFRTVFGEQEGIDVERGPRPDPRRRPAEEPQQDD